MWPLIGKFIYDVAVGTTVWLITDGLFGSDPTPTVVTPTYNSYHYSTSSNTKPLNNHISIAPPPPDFNKDSVVAAYTRQFEPISLPATPADFLSKKHYNGSTGSECAELTIVRCHSRNDTIGFTYRIFMQNQTMQGEGYYLPALGEIDFGLDYLGYAKGSFGKFRHRQSGETLNFIYLPATRGNGKLQFVDNE